MIIRFSMLWFMWSVTVAYNVVAGALGLFPGITPLERAHNCWVIAVFLFAAWLAVKTDHAFE